MADRWEPLGGGAGIWVNDDYGFGADAVLLARFAAPQKGERVCDLGTGCGILPLLFLRDGQAGYVAGVDVQPGAVSLAERSIARNGLADRAAMVCGSWSRPESLPAPASFHRVVCNPPYFPAGSGATSRSEAARLARHEQPDTLAAVTAAAARLLVNGGRFCLCHRPERLTDLLAALRGSGLEPKRLCTVQHRHGGAPWLLLVEARKGGRPGLSLEAPWIEEELQSDIYSPYISNKINHMERGGGA